MNEKELTQKIYEMIRDHQGSLYTLATKIFQLVREWYAGELDKIDGNR